jgi:hypothetical protein
MRKFIYSNEKILLKKWLKIFYVTSSLGSVTFRFIYDFITSIFPFLKETDFKIAKEN